MLFAHSVDLLGETLWPLLGQLQYPGIKLLRGTRPSLLLIRRFSTSVYLSQKNCSLLMIPWQTFSSCAPTKLIRLSFWRILIYNALASCINGEFECTSLKRSHRGRGLQIEKRRWCHLPTTVVVSEMALRCWNRPAKVFTCGNAPL